MGGWNLRRIYICKESIKEIVEFSVHILNQLFFHKCLIAKQRFLKELRWAELFRYKVQNVQQSLAKPVNSTKRKSNKTVTGQSYTKNEQLKNNRLSTIRCLRSGLKIFSTGKIHIPDFAKYDITMVCSQ